MRILTSLLLLTATACAHAETEGLELEPCSRPRVRGEVLCATLRVPENPADPEGRRIDLHVTVLPALASDASSGRAPDPVFALAGGPGTAASDMAPWLARSPLRRHRDIVLVDQRGTGSSNPLDCPTGDVPSRLRTLFNLDLAEVEICRERLRGNADPRFYTTPVAMDDLDAVRRALGADKINLWGASYGTRAALVYLRRHGAHVRTATLMGVAPPSLLLPLDLPRDAQRALDATFAACAADPRCAARHPDLETKLAALLDRLEEEPAQVLVEVPGEGRHPLELTRDLFAGTLRFALYDTRTANRIPGWITAAEGGDFGPVTDFAARFGLSLLSRFHLGMTLSVICSEDAPWQTEGDIRRHAEGTFLGPETGLHVLSACRGWPRGEIPEGFHEPVRSDVPTLLISGEFDPVTPPRHAETAVRFLTAARHLVIPGSGHTRGDDTCLDDLVRELVDAGTAEGLDPSCLDSVRRPPFETSSRR